MVKNWKIHAAYAVALGCAAMGSLGGAIESAQAQSPSNAISLKSEATIERVEIAADGSAHTVLKKPADVVVVPGDKVVFTLKYANKGPAAASGFSATNPMPGAVQFLEAAEDWAVVSVDGGVSWGKLAALTVRVPATAEQSEATRIASVEDVTHVRWVFANPIQPGATGTVSYRGVIK